MEPSVKLILSKERQLEAAKTQFQNSLNIEYKLELFNKRLKEWYNLEWMDFKKEILKGGEKLPYSMQDDLQRYFNKHKKKVLSLSKEICLVRFDLMKAN
jgi:hypothetical protein